MPNYDFTSALSSIDFELLSKDLLEADLAIRLENFREGRDKGIDLRYAPAQGHTTPTGLWRLRGRPDIVVQCKRYSKFSDLSSVLKRDELPKIQKLNPHRYILTTSVSLSPQQADELKEILSPFVSSTGDIYGRERLNALLAKHQEVERRHIKLWLSSAGVLETIINAGTYSVSREEVERTISAAQIYVKNPSFDEALEILNKHHVCIISGIPGIGKTTLARMLLIYFYNRDFEIVKIESDISEARRIPYHSKPRFYYYDDFLGQTAQADKLNKNEDQKLLDFMRSIRDSNSSLFVLTTREYILNQARLHYEKFAREKLDYRTCVIDLSKYSRRIRAQILYNHLHFSKLPRAYVMALIASRGYLKIVDHKNYNPRLIEYMTSSNWIGGVPASEYFQLFMRNLDNPALIWEHAFDQQISDSARDLLLVVTTMPVESRMEDVEKAFSTFHGTQTGTQSLPYKRDDFKRALKELDGTFISNRRVADDVLLRFQNPSIRDFVRGRALNAPLMEDVLSSCVFFEQAQWFATILFDERRYVPRHIAVECAPRVSAMLRRLVDAPSCTIIAREYQAGQHAAIQAPKQAARLGEIAAFSENIEEGGESEFIKIRLADIATALRNNQISPRSCLTAIEPLQELGFLSQEGGVGFISALKERTGKPCDLEEFKTVAELIDLLPEQFGELERQNIGELLLAFAEEFVTDYENDKFDVDDPDEIREDAATLETVSATLGVDTQDQLQRLNEHADNKAREAEEQRERRWDEVEHGGGASAADCDDIELDSMFGTLTQ